MSTVYVRALGADFDQLAPELRLLHAHHGRFDGQITVITSRFALLRLVARAFGLPPATGETSFTFTTQADGDHDIWIRSVAGRSMTSRFWRIGCQKIGERVGIITAISTLNVTPTGGLDLHVKQIRFLGCPMPGFLVPTIQAHESGQGGTYHFDVLIRLPVINALLVHYTGHLRLQRQSWPRN